MLDQDAFNSYRLFIVKQATGADLVYWDLFNRSDTGLDVLVNAVIPIVSGAVAVTGTLGVDLHLTRTTAVGTGGTAATREGTDKGASTFTNMVYPGQPLNDGITARVTPTGGATAGAIIDWTCVFTEEASDAAYSNQNTNLVRSELAGPLFVPPGSGIRGLQGAVASVGNIGWMVLFRTRPR